MNFRTYCSIFLTTLIFLVSFIQVKSANILVLMIIGSNSHRIQFQPLFKALANRGHHLTILSHTPYPKYPNITEINCFKTNTLEDLAKKVLLQRIKGELTVDVLPFINLFTSSCEFYMKDPRVFKLMNDSKFDIILQDAYLNECAFGILQQIKAPYIFFHPLPLISVYRPLYGLPFQPSIYPISFSRRSYNMTYFERLMNFGENIITQLGIKFVFFKKMEEYYRSYYPDSRSIEEIYLNASLIFTSEHLSIDFPKLSLPHIIETGGLHCRQPNELPTDLRQFTDESGEDGFIYFSMGSLFSSTALPKELVQVFVKVFSRLKQRVIWKHGNPIEGLPSNIKLMKWLPQQDLLGHQNIRLFITQGGAASMQEAVCHGVPVIGIPLAMDQDEVVGKAYQRGTGLILDLIDFNEDTLYSSIQQILNDARFHENAKVLASRFKDRPQSPLDTAVYWTEYVIRHNGASFLKPHWADFSVIKYYGIDVLGLLFLGIVLFLYMIYKTCGVVFILIGKLQFFKLTQGKFKNE